MNFREKLIKFLDTFSKQDFKDVDVDGTIYRLSTDTIEVGTEVSILKFDEEGNEITTPVDDNTWTIEGVSFRTENGVVVEVMDGEAEEGEGGSEVSIDEILFNKLILAFEGSKDELKSIKGELEKLKTDFSLQKEELEKVKADFSLQKEELEKAKSEFSKMPSNKGIKLQKSNDTKTSVEYFRELGNKFNKK